MQEPVYVLLVEDTDADAYRIQEFLRSTPTRRYELTRATSLQNARDVLTERDFDIVLLDLGLPDCRGLEAIEAIHDGWPHLPIIVQSGVDACNGRIYGDSP